MLEAHDPLRSQADNLLAALYAAKGLTVPVAPSTPARQERTVVARRGDRIVGTLIIGLDGEDGLLADTLYGAQLNTVRQQGGRICELTRFAIDPSANSSALMSAIFSLGFLVGRLMHDMTDAVIEVHPRHAAYYGRRFGYRIAGPEHICPRVGAPAVLMHVSLLEAEAQIRQDGGRRYACSPELLARLFANA
ncbi:MAG: N-acyl amino acid synthase FeeM domain-containing protein [Rhodocyclaceae bacterium]